MKIVPFQLAHFYALKVQPAQAQALRFVTEDMVRKIVGTDAHSLIEGDEILACAGIIEIYPGRAAAWSFLSVNAGKRMVAITKAFKKHIWNSPIKRIEITVDSDFHNGHRLANILGFTLEAARMTAYSMPGGDCALYARIKRHV